MTGLEAIFAKLSREPDFDAPELQAYDTADLLLLQTARSGIHSVQDSHPVVVIGDRHGALTLGAATASEQGGLGASGIRVYQDPLLSEWALTANANRLGLAHSYENHELGDELLRGAELVLVRLPRSLVELDELAWHIARYAHPSVRVLAGGRDRHMTRGMNEVLARYFGEVTAGRGWRKSRVLTARLPRAAGSLERAPFPVSKRDPELDFDLYAFGATFGGAAFDHGSRLLLSTLETHPPARPPSSIVDLGCGNGVLAVSTARTFPEATVIATDQSAAAVAATRLTAEAAGVLKRMNVHRADATSAVPDGWADLLLLNPPFHTGSTVHAGVAHRLIRMCARVLRGADGGSGGRTAGGDGRGELRLVFNSQLAYRPLVERVIGPTRQLARNRTFTVISARLR